MEETFVTPKNCIFDTIESKKKVVSMQDLQNPLKSNKDIDTV